MFVAAASANAVTPVKPVNSITLTIETFAVLLSNVSLQAGDNCKLFVLALLATPDGALDL